MVGRRWKVVGGGDRGGILVREGQDLKSAEIAERLATGAIVEEYVLEGERLSFRKLSGSGPSQGWVSLRLKDKDLLVPHESSEAEEAEADSEEEPAASEGLAPGTFSGEGRTLGSADSAASAPAAETPQERRLRALEAAQRRQATMPGVSEKKRAELMESQAKEELMRKLTDHYGRIGEELPLGLRAASSEQLRKHLEGLAKEEFKPPPRSSGGSRGSKAFSSMLARQVQEDQARKADEVVAHRAEEQTRQRVEEQRRERDEQRRRHEEEEEEQTRLEKEEQRSELEEKRRRQREEQQRRQREEEQRKEEERGRREEEERRLREEEQRRRREEEQRRRREEEERQQAERQREEERQRQAKERQRRTPRSKLMCAAPGCHLAVHSRPEMGGYCCIACSEGGEHGPRCEQVLAAADAVKADPNWTTMGGDKMEDMELEEALRLSMLEAGAAAFAEAASSQPGKAVKSGKTQEELDLEEAMRLSMLDAAPQDSPELDEEALELEEAIRLSQMMESPEEPPEAGEEKGAGAEGDGGSDASDDDSDEVPDLVPIEQNS